MAGWLVRLYSPKNVAQFYPLSLIFVIYIVLSDQPHPSESHVLAWEYWLARSFDIANNEDSVSEQVKRTAGAYNDGQWNPMRLTAAEYLERATQMADRFQRMYLRTLRQMRDLRRYTVVIQNARQVNVAANGGQQMNLQNKSKKRAKKKAASEPGLCERVVAEPAAGVPGAVQRRPTAEVKQWREQKTLPCDPVIAPAMPIEVQSADLPMASLSD